MHSKLLQWLLYGLLATIVLLQVPFLHSDPDIRLSSSRDAFTDEGLNTCQLRNYVNHAQLDFKECDNLVKTPLFNLLLFLPLKIFGTQLFIARATMLVVFLIIIFQLTTYITLRPLLLLLGLTTLFQYYVFQYIHFSLSEILSIGCILTGLFFIFRFAEGGYQSQQQLLLASLAIACSYYSKIQFLYMAPLVPFALLLFFLLEKNNRTVRKSIQSGLLYATGWLFFFLLVFITVWYYPHREIFNYVFAEEASGKYEAMLSMPKTIAFNIIMVLFSRDSWMFHVLFIGSFITGIGVFLNSTDRQFKLLFLLGLVWVILELHKLTMVYLPSRYLVSYYFAAGFLSSVVISKVIFQPEPISIKSFFMRMSFTSSQLRYAGIFLLVNFMLLNSIHYCSMYSRRQYNIAFANAYFAQCLAGKDDLVLGPWAPSLTWSSQAISKPVWRDFMNDKDIFGQHPRVIISEPDEEESNQAYSTQGIDLTEHADSVRNIAIGRWKIDIYWMQQE